MSYSRAACAMSLPASTSRTTWSFNSRVNFRRFSPTVLTPLTTAVCLTPGLIQGVQSTLALYNKQEHSSLALLYGQDPRVPCLLVAGHTLWSLGYPDQALMRNYEAIAWAQQL